MQFGVSNCTDWGFTNTFLLVLFIHSYSCCDVVDDIDDIFEITLQIEDNKVLLKTGEVVENHDGTIIIRDNDESVLLFLNAQDIKKVRNEVSDTFGDQYA